MDEQFTCELNLALIPDDELASRHIALSRPTSLPASPPAAHSI
jgi:hypothetical protein